MVEEIKQVERKVSMWIAVPNQGIMRVWWTKRFGRRGLRLYANRRGVKPFLLVKREYHTRLANSGPSGWIVYCIHARYILEYTF